MAAGSPALASAFSLAASRLRQPNAGAKVYLGSGLRVEPDEKAMTAHFARRRYLHFGAEAEEWVPAPGAWLARWRA